MYIEFDEGEKFTRNKNADVSDNLDHFDNAGYILTENDYVIDIDTLPKSIIEKLISIFEIHTQIIWTDRGCHLYFKRDSYLSKKQDRISPLGFKYEVKHSDNTKAVTVKRNGIARKVENEGIREDCPFIFSSTKDYSELYGREEGEGRNDSLYKLRMLVSENDDWKKILNFVNDYIFADPLDDKEMESLTREMAIPAERGNEYNIANWLIREFHFVKYASHYYFMEDGKYIMNEDKLIRNIYKKVGEQKTYYVKEIKAQMEARCELIDENQDFKILFNNGYLSDGNFTPIKVDDFSPYSINIDYLPEAKPVKIVDDYIKQLTGNDENYRDLLLEILGHTLIVNPEFKRSLAKFFIFVGDGGNGKGTLLQIIKKILGAENVTGLSINQFKDERYLNTFKGKLANLGDDIQDNAIDDGSMKILKNISTCDFIAYRELYANAQGGTFTGSLIFTSNHIIKSWEKGESYKRRVMWLPMYTKPKKKDPLFITKLTTDEALEYWIRLIVEGHKRLYQNGVFTQSEKVKEFNDNYHRENNPALDYIEGMGVESFHGVPVGDINQCYEDWCVDNSVNYSKKMLSDTLEEDFNMEKVNKHINGKTTYIFKIKGKDL